MYIFVDFFSHVLIIKSYRLYIVKKVLVYEKCVKIKLYLREPSMELVQNIGST